MKKTTLPIFIFTLFSLLFTPSAQAQLPVTNIETLILDIWPDYDEPNVLVLMTGTLPANTSLPATVTIPLATGAEINAVARFLLSYLLSSFSYDLPRARSSFGTSEISAGGFTWPMSSAGKLRP